jgi:hypothetical protein
MIVHADLSSAFFLHLLISTDFKSFSIQSNHLNFGLLIFFFHPLSREILSSRCCHQTFLPDDRLILGFLLFVLLPYLAFYTLPSIHRQFGFSSHFYLLLGHIYYLVFFARVLKGTIWCALSLLTFHNQCLLTQGHVCRQVEGVEVIGLNLSPDYVDKKNRKPRFSAQVAECNH